MSGRIVWQHVDRTDPHKSGWWVLARLIVEDDGRVLLETNTRSSVVSTEVPVTPDALAALRFALDAL